MNTQEIKSIIMRELPKIIRTDEEVRRFILNIGREQFADQSEANRRFDRIMDELAEERRRSDRKWEENQRKSDEKWEEHRKEHKQTWEEHRKEQEQMWEEHRKEHKEMISEIKKLHESTIGALGARWGIYSEQTFRNALKGILEETFDVEVINITEFDDEGYVFGKPDQVELDIIIRDGTLLICELKSSIDKAGMYIFERKVRFYEKRHQREATKMIVISPMVDKRAQVVAEKLGIEVYTSAEAVEEL